MASRSGSSGQSFAADLRVDFRRILPYSIDTLKTKISHSTLACILLRYFYWKINPIKFLTSVFLYIMTGLPSNLGNNQATGSGIAAQPGLRILGDPVMETCPCFGSPAYGELMAALADKKNISREDAVAESTAIWQAEHDLRLLQWGEQCRLDSLALDQQEEALRQQADIIEEAERERLRALIDKRCPVFAPVDRGIMISNESTRFISQWIVDKLVKGHLVPLSHFLPEARAEALNAARGSVATGAYVLEKTEDGGIGLRQQAEIASTKKVTSDDNLTWRQIGIAKNILLESLKRALWPQDHINIWATFYANLEAHDLHQEPNGERLLIRYHADARRQWHDKLLHENIAFDVSIISEKRLDALETQLRREDDVAHHASFTQVTSSLVF